MPVSIAAASPNFASPRLVRDAEATSGANSANSVRQNRSLQNAERNSNGNNDADANADADAVAVAANGNNNNVNNHKFKQFERRQRFRMIQHSSSNDDTNSNSNSNSNNDLDGTSISTAPSSPSADSAHQQMSMSTGMANHRQPQAMRFNDGDDAGDFNQTAQTESHKNITTKAKQQQQTLKTPRMIQRLVAGHIQNAQGRSSYEISAVTTNSTVSNSSTTTKPTPLYFRRKQSVLSSSYRHASPSSTTTESISPTTTKVSISLGAESDDDNGHDDDEALLDDPNDFDNWDNGILRLSAGSGKEQSPKSKKFKEDSKKTLADQVRDGKYGLIEQELFKHPPKRPGILSYLPNKEVPIDNERNYGGLNEEDIWLAEDHLLVIKGGTLNDDNANEPWAPIDDYVAPGRQIKIPPNPKVPPPFPVQLEENGQIQFIGNNKFTIVYPVANESIPIYIAGPQANYTAPESDGDNEKNLLTRPGSAKGSAEDEPSYIYPSPYPPWIFHNQTFVNPFLNVARPIKFPGLGPFSFARNGSLDNVNITDFLDEDDPTLYYPPAYSFVYKNNYTNPVPPGPLVPGIVLPPPANQFSRLEKGEKKVTKLSPPTRQRLYPTTSPASSTTTSSSSSTTTELPAFRQVITKITEYTPKIITITSAPPTTTAVPMRSTTITPLPLGPVAIPVPAYPGDIYPKSRPNIVTFIPTTPEPAIDTLSKSHPIYYEYFEAKRQPPTSNVIDEFLASTVDPPPASKPVKIYVTSKRPFKGQSHRNYGQALAPHRHFVPEKVVYITPKPDVHPKQKPPTPSNKPRPLENFEREVNALRETLRFYQNQQLRDNSIPRAPKAKPLYEYTYDANKNLQPVQPAANNINNFQPPTEFDEEPFKPMVTYSPPVDDENAFRAIAYEKLDNELVTPPPQPKEQSSVKFQSTTTLVPVQPEAQFGSMQRPKKLRFGAKYLQSPVVTVYPSHQSQSDYSYATTPSTILTTDAPWEFVEKRGYVSAQQQQQRYAERLQMSPPVSPKNRGFHGYYYADPPTPPVQQVQPVRQNNRFYDVPFQNSVRKATNHRQPPPPQHAQQQKLQQQQQQQQPPLVWNLENDTYVNYAPNRPPLNPDAEFINPYPAYPYPQRYPTPPLSHQSQYYAPPQIYQQIPRQHYQPLPPQIYQPIHRQQQPQSVPPPNRQQLAYPIHRDILVNYRQPVPPINPDSEYISHPQVVRYHPNPHNPNYPYRSNAYRQPPLGSANVGDDSEPANAFYITPKYRRANNSNNNNNNNSNNNSNANNSHNNNGNANTSGDAGNDSGSVSGSNGK